MPRMTKDPVASPPPGPQMVTPTGRSVPHRGDGVVVELTAERRRRLLRDLDLGPTVPVSCGPGPCWCCGASLGRGAS
jgi:hypothetical protein